MAMTGDNRTISNAIEPVPGFRGIDWPLSVKGAWSKESDGILTPRAWDTDPLASKRLREWLAEQYPTTNLIRRDDKFQFCLQVGGVLQWLQGEWSITEEQAVHACALLVIVKAKS